MFSENLKKIRQHLGLSVAKFADKLDIPQRTLTTYERGERTPSWKLFTQLYQKLNINLNWFVSGKGKMFNAPQYEDVKDEILNEVNQVLVKYGIKKL